MGVLNRKQHLRISSVREMVIEMRKQLEMIISDDKHNTKAKQKAKALVREFQSASQEYQKKRDESDKNANHNSNEKTDDEKINKSDDEPGNKNNINQFDAEKLQSIKENKLLSDKI